MSQLDILRPVELDLNFFPSPPPSSTATPADHEIIDVLFPDLPPLLVGHPDMHLNNGILDSARAFAAGEIDAEHAFFVADLSRVWRQHMRWKAVLPDVEPFYAVKCNPDPFILRLMSALGVNFDCASHGEISQVLDLGVDPNRIIFANPCKPASFIRHAAKAGVSMMTFDNSDELHKVARLFPGARLVIRILTDDSNSLCRLGLKYGTSLDDVPRLLALARELQLNVVGVSFHVGSGNYDTNAFRDAVARARRAFDFGASIGYKFTLLDVGGGFEDVSFERTARALREALAEHFPPGDGTRIIAEPGRFYVSGAFSLATNIIARRAGPGAVEEDDVDEDPDQPRVMYYINDGVYGSFNCILFDHQTVHPHVLTLGGSFTSTAAVESGLVTSSLWGPTCDSLDCVCPTVRLPHALEVGDWLGFRNMGAYTICAASQFNGFRKSVVRYTSGVGAESTAVRRAFAKVAVTN